MLFSFKWILAKITQNDPFASNTFTFFPKCKRCMRLDYNFLTSPLKGLCWASALLTSLRIWVPGWQAVGGTCHTQI